MIEKDVNTKSKTCHYRKTKQFPNKEDEHLAIHITYITITKDNTNGNYCFPLINVRIIHTLKWLLDHLLAGYNKDDLRI